EEEVDLGELLERLRAMLVQGLGAGKSVEAELEPVSLAGNRATALALVFSELFQNALEHGGGRGRVEPASRNGDAGPAVSGAGGAHETPRSATGPSTVGALVRDELKGPFELRSEAGTRAEVVFPPDPS